jgi:hypothetical protein
VINCPELPKPKPKMTEDEAIACIQEFAAQTATLLAQLEEREAAEDYDACEVLGAELEALEARYLLAQDVVPMSSEEATSLMSTFEAESSALQARLDASMAAEDYDACDTINAQLEELTKKRDLALKLVPEGVPPQSEKQAAAEVTPVVGGSDSGAPAPAPAAEPATEPAAEPAASEVSMFDMGGFSAPAPAAEPAAGGFDLGGFDFGANLDILMPALSPCLPRSVPACHVL